MDLKSPFDSVLRRTLEHALDHLQSLQHKPVSASATLAQLRGRLKRPLPERGAEAAQVIEQLAADVEGGIVGCVGGRFFGWVVGGVLPAALAADWLTSAWDQNAALYASGPAEAVVEEACGDWLKQLLGLPRTASFALVTGCQMAHATCLAAARHALLERQGWDVERKGLNGAPPIRVLSGQRHGSIERAVRLLGLGSDSVCDLPVDGLGRLRADSLASALDDQPNAPAIVLLQAGDINTGAFDPFKELIPIAQARSAWVHVDGAFGLWASVSPGYRHLVEGVGAADSWAADGHKWLNVPYDSGYAFVAHPSAHRASMTCRASYLTYDEDARDQIDWTPEWSRRGRGFATYAAIRQLGRAGLADLIERNCRQALELVTRIGKLPGAETVHEPLVNQGLVRFLDQRPGAADTDHDRKTDEMIAALRQNGEAFFTDTTWRGMRCMRVSVCNWQTGEEDVERAVTAVRDCLARVSHG